MLWTISGMVSSLEVMAKVAQLTELVINGLFTGDSFHRKFMNPRRSCCFQKS